MPIHIAIIGAGLSGAYLTRLLLDAGFRVTLFDKSRGTGGRIASCSIGQHSADLGTPFFSPQSSRFAQWLDDQPEINSWSPLESDFAGQTLPLKKYFIANPRQSALTRRLIQGAKFLPSQKVGYIWPERSKNGMGTVVRDEKGLSLGHFDAAIVTAPAKQAAALLEAVPRFVHKSLSATPRISWVQVLVINPTYSVDSELITGEHQTLFRCIKNSSKNTQDSSTNEEVWVLEATEVWSQLHEHSLPSDVGNQLTTAFFDLLPFRPKILAERTHRWLYARHSVTGDGFLWDPITSIGACGDWLANDGIEGAWKSAAILSEQLINHFSVSDHEQGFAKTTRKFSNDISNAHMSR